MKPVRCLLCSILLYVSGAWAIDDSNRDNLTTGIDASHVLSVSDNRFVVDSDVRNILILMSSEDGNSIKITSPMQNSWSINQNQINATWQKVENLYAVSIDNPAVGQWQIEGKLSAKPQIIVKSTLQMQTPTLPNNMIRGESLLLSALVTLKDLPVFTGPLFDNLTVSATIQNMATNERFHIDLVQNAQPQQDPGLFQFRYHLTSLPGLYELNIKANGLMFQRERLQRFYVYDYPAAIEAAVDGETEYLKLIAKMNSGIFDNKTIEFSSVLTNVKGESSVKLMSPNDEGNWVLTQKLPDDIDQIQVILTGYLKDSRKVSVIFPTIDGATLLHDGRMAWQKQRDGQAELMWRDIFDEQLMTVLPYTPVKLNESLLLSIKPFLLVSIESQYPNQVQGLIKSLNEDYYNRSIKLHDATQSKPVEAAPVQKRKVTKTVPNPLKSKRKWFITMFSIFTILFLALLAAIVFVVLRSKGKEAEQKLAAAQPNAEQPAAMEAVPVPEPAKAEEVKTEEVKTEPEVKLPEAIAAAVAESEIKAPEGLESPKHDLSKEPEEVEAAPQPQPETPPPQEEKAPRAADEGTT